MAKFVYISEAKFVYNFLKIYISEAINEGFLDAFGLPRPKYCPFYPKPKTKVFGRVRLAKAEVLSILTAL